MSPTLSARNEAVLALGRLYIAGIINGLPDKLLESRRASRDAARQGHDQGS